MNRAFRGVWIPAELWMADDLSHTEKFLLVEIDSLDNERGCFANNHHFAKFLGLNKMYVSQLISGLIEKEYVYAEQVDEKRILHSNLKKLYGQRVIVQQQPVEDNSKKQAEGMAASISILRTIDGFLELWQEWIKYRKEKKKPVTKTTEKKQLEQLAAWHSAGYDVIECINQSMLSGWLGLFPKIKQQNTTYAEQESVFDGKIKVR